VEEAWIETRQRHLLVATDGEVTPMANPLHFRTRPGALRVQVPHPPTSG
jgi:diacylglycerol kinase family enzyme